MKAFPALCLTTALLAPSVAAADRGRSADAPGQIVREFVQTAPPGPARGRAISEAARGGFEGDCIPEIETCNAE